MSIPKTFTRNFLALCACVGLAASASASASAVAATSVAADATLRAISGAKPIDRLVPAKTALLVIDFQNEYFTGRLPIPDGAQALANTQRLIAFADQTKMPVYHIQHVAPADSPLFALGGEGVKFHPDMQPRAGDITLQKSTVSAFGSTDLDRRLKKAGIDTLIISGLMTHACVAGAARDAAPLGYNVVVAADASATRNILRANGTVIDKDSLHNAALAEVEDTFGSVLTTAEILELKIR